MGQTWRGLTEVTTDTTDTTDYH